MKVGSSYNSVITVGLCLIILLLSFPTDAQQRQKVARIGFLSPASKEQFAGDYRAFVQGLRELGYIEGQNIVIESRWAEGQTDRVAALAAELVSHNVDVIVSTGGALVALAAKKTTTTVPIIFTAGGDLEKVGLVSSLARPGGNLTGVSLLTVELNGKRLELLKDISPKVHRVAMLANPRHPAYATQTQQSQAAAKALGLQLQLIESRGPDDLESVFSALTSRGVEALLVSADPIFYANRKRIVDLAWKHRVPSVFEFKEFAEVGGLMSYGTNIAEMYRYLATYVDKILKGSKPADLPVEQPTKFELVINLKTAKHIGITIPPNVLARADRVIR